MQNQPAILLADDRYDRLVEAVLNAEPSPWSGKVDADQIKLALCGVDIYPASSASED